MCCLRIGFSWGWKNFQAKPTNQEISDKYPCPFLYGSAPPRDDSIVSANPGNCTIFHISIYSLVAVGNMIQHFKIIFEIEITLAKEEHGKVSRMSVNSSPTVKLNAVW